MTDAPKESVLSCRVPASDAVALHAIAAARGVTASDLIRDAVHKLIRPVGWSCPHVAMTSSVGVLTAPEAGCGCAMQPIYAGTTT